MIVIDEAQYAIKRDPEFVKSILNLKMKPALSGTGDDHSGVFFHCMGHTGCKDAFGDGFRRIDVLHKVEDLNFLEVVRTFPALSVSDCIRIYGSIAGCRDIWKPGIRKFHTGRIFTGLC